MKNSVIKRLLCGLLVGVTACSMVACGGNKGPRHADADETKTQLELCNFERGYGREWVDSLIERFEEACAEVSFEEGKKGVQVWYNGVTDQFTNADIGAAPYEVFFLENSDYYELKMGGRTLVAIDDIVKNNDLTLYDGSSFKAKVEAAGYSLGGANETIESKLNEQQRAFYTADGQAPYYGVPSYMSTYGIIYDIELWETKGYYIVDSDEFHIQSDIEDDIDYSTFDLSVGPDGISGTYDDGLPRTYDEFWKLCNKIYNDGNIPVCWPGQYYEQHLNYLDFNLINNYLGYDQMLLNYTFEGHATDLIKVDSDGRSLMIDANGVPTLEEADITLANAYELWRSASVYYAAGFIKDMLTKSKSHYDDTTADNNMSHTQNQRAFIEWGYKVGNKNIGMLIDGSWWQREATPYSKLAYPENPNYLMTHKYGWMPMPHATLEKAEQVRIANENGEKTTLVADSLNAHGVIKNGITEGKIAAAKALLLFSCSYDSCVDFTKKTATIKGLDYDISAEDMVTLSPFTQNFLEYANHSEKIYNFSGLDFYNSNKSQFSHTSRYQAYINEYMRNAPLVYKKYPNTSLKTYMEQVYKSAKDFFSV